MYKFTRDQCTQRYHLATVFALPRGRASKTAQGSILLPTWIPKSLQNRFAMPLGSHWKRQLDFTSIKA